MKLQTQNHKQPKTSLQTLSWRSNNGLGPALPLFLFDFASPSKLTQQASKLETFFWLGSRVPGATILY